MQRRERPTRAATAVLKGKIFDADGEPMSPSFTHRGHRLHRYYVSATLEQGRRIGDVAIRRVPAQSIEALVLDRLRTIARAKASEGWDRLGARLQRLEIHASTVQLGVVPTRGSGDLAAEVEELQSRLQPGERAGIDAIDPMLIRIVLPVQYKLRAGRTWMVAPGGCSSLISAKIDKTLVQGLKTAHRLMGTLHLRPGDAELPEAKSPTNTYERKLVAIAMLAPDIQAAILEGRQPPGLTLKALIDDSLPMAWSDQRRHLGFATA